MEASVQTIEDLLQKAKDAVRLEMDEIGIDIGNPDVVYLDQYNPTNRLVAADIRISQESGMRVQRTTMNRFVLPSSRAYYFHNFGIFFSFDAIKSYFTCIVNQHNETNPVSPQERAIGNIIVYKAARDILEKNKERLWILIAARHLAHEQWHNFEDKQGTFDFSSEGTAEFAKEWAYKNIAARRGIDLEKEKIDNKLKADPLEAYLYILYSTPRKIAKKYARSPLDLLNPDIRYEIQEETIRELKREAIELPSGEKRKIEAIGIQASNPELIEALRIGYTQDNFVMHLREIGAERMAYEAERQDCSRYLAHLEGLFGEQKGI